MYIMRGMTMTERKADPVLRATSDEAAFNIAGLPQ